MTMTNNLPDKIRVLKYNFRENPGFLTFFSAAMPDDQNSGRYPRSNRGHQWGHYRVIHDGLLRHTRQPRKPALQLTLGHIS